MVRWGRWKDQTALSLALVSCSGALTPSGSQEFNGRPRDNKTIGTVQLKLPFPRSIDKGSTGACGAHQATAPSTQLVGCDGDWPAYRASSVGSMERSNQAGAGHRLLEPMERSSGPLPWLWPVVGRLTRSGSREFKGRPRDNKTIGSVQPKLLFPRSIDSQQALVVFTRPQPQAPNLLGATGTGQHAGPNRALSGKNQLKTNLSVPCNSAECFSERNFPSTVEQPVVTEYRCF